MRPPGKFLSMTEIQGGGLTTMAKRNAGMSLCLMRKGRIRLRLLVMVDEEVDEEVDEVDEGEAEGEAEEVVVVDKVIVDEAVVDGAVVDEVVVDRVVVGEVVVVLEGAMITRLFNLKPKNQVAEEVITQMLHNVSP
jgi:hypothetical protein